MSMTPNATLQFLLGRLPGTPRGAVPPVSPEFAAVLAATAGEANSEQAPPRQPRLLMASTAVAAPDLGTTAAEPGADPESAASDAPERKVILSRQLPAEQHARAGASSVADAARPLYGTIPPASAAEAKPLTVSPPSDGLGEPVVSPVRGAAIEDAPGEEAAPRRAAAPARLAQAVSAEPLPLATPSTAPRDEPGDALLQRLARYLTATPDAPGTSRPEASDGQVAAAPASNAPGQAPATAVAAPLGAFSQPAPAAPAAPAAVAPKPQPLPRAAMREVQADRQSTLPTEGDRTDDGVAPTRRDGLREPVQPLRRGVASHAGTAEKPVIGPSTDALTITRRETHFAPVRRPASVDAHLWTRNPVADTAPPRETPKPSFSVVADQVKPAMEQARADLETRAPQLLQAQQATAGGKLIAPVRVMEISLQPASLGALAVTMRITGTGLRVSISASQRETAMALEEDLDKLTALVREAGFDPDAVEVVFGGPSVRTQVS
ncbi:flagellar hook-length control protein FliK [Acuticoccus sp. MNP-M23]|uniref:flagellar hook-length control protein FliK n=1 Tax=Acuticoccus sp. MNP-M23 TaxID=3072793 RepID=UPI0028160F4B|nr:flagellar hook-length control protein FliK [Acuticoccus sp. MNP-M23]WMS41783.1 flagellar hook-length control protein FliK [Acuticoccus sp. MNP-M23]